MPSEYLSAVRRQDQTVNRLFAFLGATLVRAEFGKAIVSAPIRPEFSQGGGMVAGGILATLADEAMAHAVLSALPEGKAAVTAEMNIRYLRGLKPDESGEVRAEAGVVKAGQSLFVLDCRIRDSKDRLLATAGATFYVINAA